jgi:DNA mismatch repair ATPase MutS
MSGKSTFLRSLGINMVLSGMGSVVCASEANVHGAGFYAFVRFFV